MTIESVEFWFSISAISELLPDRALPRISVAIIENSGFLVWCLLFGLVVSVISEILPDRAFTGNPTRPLRAFVFRFGDCFWIW